MLHAAGTFRKDGENFTFHVNESLPVGAAPGIYQMCFCRPDPGWSCENVSSFMVIVGPMFVHGPFERITDCTVGALCTVSFTGIALSEGDVLRIVRLSEDSANICSNTTYYLQNATLAPDVSRGLGLHIDLGVLGMNTAGTYQVCWCPVQEMCLSSSSFQAPAGILRANCPAGYYFRGLNCRLCGSGYYCPGGEPAFAVRLPCREGETTVGPTASADSECQCSKGYYSFKGTCVVCPKNFFKPNISSEEECTACPPNQTTFTQGAISISSCVGANVTASNVSAAPAVSFRLSVTADSSTNLTDEDLWKQLVDTLRISIGSASRMDVDSLSISLAPASSSAARRLSEPLEVVIRIRYATALLANISAQELDVDDLAMDIDSALQQDPALSNLRVDVSDLGTEMVRIECPNHASLPPGVLATHSGDCACRPGYAHDAVSQTCSPCAQGRFKSSLANAECENCDPGRWTLEDGQSDPANCWCNAGTYENESGTCEPCDIGYYCDGRNYQTLCPPNSTTISMLSTAKASCQCKEGHQRVSGAVEMTCEPCAPGRFKEVIGNDECTQTCPTDATSRPAASRKEDCFCEQGFHADLKDQNRKDIERCIDCGPYNGLICQGGLDEEGQHVQPKAVAGWFQTGRSSALPCQVTRDGFSVCLGNTSGGHIEPFAGFPNACANGSTGMLCGECPAGWARGAYLEPCEPCDAHSALAFGLAIAADLGRTTLQNFVKAAMAAGGAGTLKPLHTVTLRNFQHWVDACSILADFNLTRMRPFDFSLGDKTEQPEAGEPVAMPHFAWPAAATDAMTLWFHALSLVPRVNVDFAAQCQADAWFGGSQAAKRVVPAVYYLTRPVLTFLGSIIICLLVVYVAIPLINMTGFAINERAGLIKKVTNRLRNAALKLKANDEASHTGDSQGQVCYLSKYLPGMDLSDWNVGYKALADVPTSVFEVVTGQQRSLVHSPKHTFKP